MKRFGKIKGYKTVHALKFHAKWGSILLGLTILCVIVIVNLFEPVAKTPSKNFYNSNEQTGLFPVAKVIDGDTIWIRENWQEDVIKVRLLCVDTPEISGERKHPLGFKAKSFTMKILRGKRVKLQKEAKGKNRDIFGRFLRYVFTEDGKNLNLEIVSAGWSAYYTKYGKCSLYHDKFIEAEKNAKEAKLGIWADPLFLSGGYLKNAYGK